jgi:N-acetyl-anhydromuramyl-L-alanine amidase AmpD
VRLLLSIALVFGAAIGATTPAFAADSAPSERLAATGTQASPYPDITWIGAARGNYSVGRSSGIWAIVIHETDGSWTSATNWFRNPYSHVSAHYIVRAWDGAVLQFVAESDTAYHATIANPWSIGIEHEFDRRYGIYHTDAQYRSSARLVCAIASRYGIPVDRNHIIGHNEVPGSTHSDPGPWWNWNYFMSLVSDCSTVRAMGVARGGIHTLSDRSYVPAAGLAAGNKNQDVALLQWDLVYLGYLSPADVASGSGRFGPVTQAALQVFQEASGMEPSGSYDAATAAALGEAVDAIAAGVPLAELEYGDESDEVTQLQQALAQLGYMDVVSGYYGDLTTDAVTRFQQDNGIEATGAYEAVTWIALAALARSS